MSEPTIIQNGDHPVLIDSNGTHWVTFASFQKQAEALDLSRQRERTSEEEALVNYIIANYLGEYRPTVKLAQLIRAAAASRHTKEEGSRE